MSDFSNAVALITGAASGIGAATASLLAQRGAKKLILCDSQEGKLADFAFSLPSERQLLIGDVADERLWTEADLSGLTHAVVNAGIGHAAPIAETSLAEWRRVMAVNLDGAFLALRAAMRAMRDGGSIVLTASAAGFKPEKGIGAYAASKAAMIQLARVAAKEGAPRIRVNAIAPGGTQTPLWSDQPFFNDLVEKTGSEEAAYREMAGSATPLERFAQPEEIAAQIVFLLSEEAAFTTGTCLVADGGYSL
ncbi:MAG TPA: SDR family oxidoreductase [Allosphingosinicella sp.]|jgi:NAD(P)-dependent dehydrogenase (short-subunit alcohol dehydrogenase family)|uniref:SDR family NAD(P)-dependent oxidoreductase n=1 Tax=Allosphingosinicella sp. TaxID=2823234 RepID=UPI002F27DD09